jgi:hypothetical protein
MVESTTLARNALDTRRDLERTRDRLLARLHDRASDVAATEELQSVYDALAASDLEVDDGRPARLRRAGLSFFQRLRERRRRESPT